jgi:hypothetical protein
MKKAKKSDIEEFIALPDWEKNEVVKEIEAQSPEQRLADSRPLSARDRDKWSTFKKRAAQNRTGSQDVQKVSINVKQSLLKQADRYAKQHKLNRSQLFARSLQRLIETS